MPGLQTIEMSLTDWVNQTVTTLYPELDLQRINTQVVATVGLKHGDYQCNAAMAMAGQLKKPPREIAESIKGAACPESIDKIEIAGPGFINFFLKDEWIIQELARIEQDSSLGVPDMGSGQKVVIDYSAPNIAKPMHIGHIRSTVIGNALDRMFRFLGYDVIADNHIGDWGTQFGLLILGYRHFVDEEKLATDAISELERIYQLSYARSQEDENWLDEARAELVKLQQGDKDNRELWLRFIKLSKVEFTHTYDRLNISFDIERGESYYNDQLDNILNLLKEKELLTESEGAQIIDLEAEGLPVSIVRKRDGGFNYTTTDIATLLSRCKEFTPSQIIYVTDERQQLHFRQLFAIANKLGIDVSLKHVWFGLMRLPEATFSTRQGNVIKLSRLLDEAEARALELVQTSNSTMTEKQQKEVARVVGIGAVKYADLSQNPQSMVTFTWEKALSLEGNSAPYLQYAYARISSVRDKYKEQFPDVDFKKQPFVLSEQVERKLAIHLIRFAETLHGAVRNYRPNFLADYLYELAQLYSSFYQAVPFIKADAGVRESRVRLCDLVAATLRQGLSLLGIETLERI